VTILFRIGSLIAVFAAELAVVDYVLPDEGARMVAPSSRVVQVDRREFMAPIPPAALVRRALLLRVLGCGESPEQPPAPMRQPPLQRLGPSSSWRAAMLARQRQSAYLSERLDPRGLLAARGSAAVSHRLF